MNTLLGELGKAVRTEESKPLASLIYRTCAHSLSFPSTIATYNDIRYPRYRLAFKLRRLQTCFLLHRVELSTMQDIFHSTGLQPLPVENEINESLLASIVEEIYSSLKTNLPNMNPSSLQEAQTTCFNWFMLALQW